LNHFIKKKKKGFDEPPSPVFSDRKEERLYHLAFLEKKASEPFAHEIIPVRYLELKRKINLDHIEQSLENKNTWNSKINRVNNFSLIDKIT
jgi:hypothetical protein